jgi:Cu(I)/Ag(I) efflux system membrane fusion protein
MKTLLLALFLATPLLLHAAPVDNTDAVLDAGVAAATALASDDLAAAQAAGKNLKEIATSAGQPSLAQTATRLADSTTLEDAREAFKALSPTLVTLATDRPGYYLFSCPMVHAGWVQKTKPIRNPYMGASMLTCGVMQTTPH